MTDRWPHLQALIDEDGALNIGHIEPISGAAVALQGRQVHAMLRINDGESLVELLDRLDVAVGNSIDGGASSDEINR